MWIESTIILDTGELGSFKAPLPMYLGHEPAGVVVDPNGSADFKSGDRVAVELAAHASIQNGLCVENTTYVKRGHSWVLKTRSASRCMYVCKESKCSRFLIMLNLKHDIFV